MSNKRRKERKNQSCEIIMPRLWEGNLEKEKMNKKEVKEIKDYNFNSLNKSSVLNTLIRDCFFNLLSLDQIGQFSFNANAKYCVSSSSGVINSASFLKSLYSDIGITLTNQDNIFLYNSKTPISILDFNIISSKCLFNSSNAYSGEYNSKLGLINNFLVGEYFLKKENSIFISTTNNIYDTSFKNLLCIDFLASLPNLIQSSSVSSEFSSNLSNFLSNKALFTFSDKKFLTISDQFNSGRESNPLFNSSDIDNVMFGILLPPQIIVNTVKVVLVYKSFGSETISQNLNFGNDLCLEFMEDEFRLLKKKCEEKAPIVGSVLSLDCGKE